MVIVMSDASYRASEPLAAHSVANAKKLPVVVIVFNEDASVRSDAVAEACGSKGMRVENPRELAAAIRAALQIARGEKRQVLLNVCIG
jgi:thiamine pyrophosphate-dependent acetolactate synthase large subunit-like protein